MLPDALAAAGCAAAAAALAAAAPSVLARLPEPPPGEVAEDAVGDAVDAADAAAEEAVAVETPVKVPYVELASRRGLRWWLAASASVGAGSIGLALGQDPSLPLWVFVAALGATLSYVDWTTRLLPFGLVAPAYPVTHALVLLAAVLSQDWHALLRAGLAWVAVYAVFTLMWLIYRRGIGYGDVRLSGILATALGWLGWSHVLVGMYAAFVLGAVIGGLLALAKVVDRRGYPFGPFLILGTWLGVLLG